MYKDLRTELTQRQEHDDLLISTGSKSREKKLVTAFNLNAKLLNEWPETTIYAKHHNKYLHTNSINWVTQR